MNCSTKYLDRYVHAVVRGFCQILRLESLPRSFFMPSSNSSPTFGSKLNSDVVVVDTWSNYLKDLLANRFQLHLQQCVSLRLVCFSAPLCSTSRVFPHYCVSFAIVSSLLLSHSSLSESERKANDKLIGFVLFKLSFIDDLIQRSGFRSDSITLAD